MKTRYTALLLATLSAGPALHLSRPLPASAQGAQQVSFKEDVLPILQVHCASCHGAGGAGMVASGVDLTTWQGVIKGTKYGPMVVPGSPETSNLMLLLDWKVSPQIRMPHDKKQLPAGERDTIRTWIRQGAKDN